MTRAFRLAQFAYQTCRAGLARSLGVSGERIGAERDAQWYDLSFSLFPHWKKHYSESRYFFLWSIIADRLVTSGHQSSLDIGCRPGQFACLLRDRGMPVYHGLDFSARRIEQARSLCPEYRFYAEDAFETEIFEEADYDSVVMTEVLEHVERDLPLIQRSMPGVRLIASVPNFPSSGHVRHFLSTDDVRERYEQVLDRLRVDSLRGNARGKIYFIVDGIVRPGAASRQSAPSGE